MKTVKILFPLLVLMGMTAMPFVLAEEKNAGMSLVDSKNASVEPEISSSKPAATGVLQGKLSHHKRVARQAQIVPLGNGLAPDPYVPETPYHSSPPANRLIRPVSTNSR
jgi:hypothetical protein